MLGRAFSTSLSLSLLLALVACDRGPRAAGDGASGASSAAGERAPFRAALLTPGPISDQSWNGGAYAGLLRIRDSLGAQVSHIQTRTPAEFEENFRQYGAQGYQIVFGHGFEFQDAARRVAPRYPKTAYVVTSATATGPNLYGIAFDFANASYLAGMLAGTMTRTNVIGVIGGAELPPVRESFTAFAAGARRVNPRVQVLTSYIGNWDDVSAGKEQAIAQIGRRADVIFQNADAAGLGVFQAAKERDVWVIGSNADQNAVAPTVTLGSVVIDLPHAFLAVAREVQGGAVSGRVIHLGMNENVVTLVLNPALASRVPPATRAALDSARAALAAGTLRPVADAAASAAPATPPAPR